MLFLILFTLILWTGAGYYYFYWCYCIQQEHNFQYKLKESNKYLFYLLIGPLSWYDILVNGKDINNG